MSKAKSQTIGCKVTSCAYNMSGCDCGLERIEVEPMCGCHTGNPADESLCGSYKCRAVSYTHLTLPTRDQV